MVQKVEAYIEKYQMITEGDHIVAGVSGGADSVALLLVLLEIQKKKKISIEAVHLEHGIRGEESRSDQKFVERLCERLRVPCYSVSYDIEKIAAEEKLTVEEAGRKMRYQVFHDRLGKRRGKIAVAHHRNDQAETILFHLARGTGMKGIGGMAPVQGEVIRPLLCVSRREIEVFLTQNRQEYRIDQTNYDRNYARNRIRHEVVPQLEEVNRQAVAHLCQAAEYVREAEQYLEEQTRKIKENCINEQELDIKQIRGLPKLMQKRVLFSWVADQVGSRRNLTAEHIASVGSLVEKQVGRKISLPGGYMVYREYETLRIQKETRKRVEDQAELPICTTELKIPGEVLSPEQHARIVCTLRKVEKNNQIPKNRYTKWFDYDKINGSVQVRTRQLVDFMTIDEQGGRQSLKKYMINEKIPAKERDSILLVADDDQILWVIGYRISEAYKVTAQTTHILEICYIREEEAIGGRDKSSCITAGTE